MEQKTLLFVWLAFVFVNQAKGIRTCDIEEKFIKANASETPGFQIFSNFYETCVTINASDYVTVEKCDTENVGQRWMWINDDLLLHKSTQKCLAVDGDISAYEELKVLPCNDSSFNQRWTCIRNVLRLLEISMYMTYPRDGENHLIISQSASVKNEWKIYQIESTLCTAKLGYQRFQIYSKAFNLCASVRSDDYVVAETCHDDVFSPIQAWQWINNKQLRHEHTGKCLDIYKGIAARNRLRVMTCNSTSQSQQWACNGLFLEAGGTSIKMNYGNVDKPHILVYPAYADGQYSQWTIYQTSNSLCSINPYNEILKIVTVALKAFCSIECAKEPECNAYIFLQFKKLDNCLLSSNPDGNQSIPYHGQSFNKHTIDQECNINYNCQSGSTCVRRCVEPFFKCVCPSWASGEFCENLNPAYNLSLLPWRLVSNPTIVDCDACGENVWAINADNRVYIFVNATRSVTNGKWKQISCGGNGMFTVAMSGPIFRRIGVSNSNPQGTKWVGFSDEPLKQISSGNFGVLWGVSLKNTSVYRYGDRWIDFNETCLWVSCGGFGCWVVTVNGSASFRTGVNSSNPGGLSWINTGGSFKQLGSAVHGQVYAVDMKGQMYTREGINVGNPAGYKWSKVGDLRFSHVSVGDKFVLGIHKTSSLYALP